MDAIERLLAEGRAKLEQEAATRAAAEEAERARETEQERKAREETNRFCTQELGEEVAKFAGFLSLRDGHGGLGIRIDGFAPIGMNVVSGYDQLRWSRNTSYRFTVPMWNKTYWLWKEGYTQDTNDLSIALVWAKEAGEVANASAQEEDKHEAQE